MKFNFFKRSKKLQNDMHWPWCTCLAVAIAAKLNKFGFKQKTKQLKRYLKGNGQYFDFKGVCLANFPDKKDMFKTLTYVVEDVLLFHLYHNDNYEKSLVRRLDKLMEEGPYGYTDGVFDVTVKPDDIVIDAGAWIGDFSAYAAYKGATAYAFEPTAGTYNMLLKTVKLNQERGRTIIPVQKGLSNKPSKAYISINSINSGANTVTTDCNQSQTEEIVLITLDEFVESNGINRIDFIKSDIEGEERNLLLGATNVLKKFAPKLAICTYHSLEDPYVLTKIILDANPSYKIVYLRHKLMAMVI